MKAQVTTERKQNLSVALCCCEWKAQRNKSTAQTVCVCACMRVCGCARIYVCEAAEGNESIQTWQFKINSSMNDIMSTLYKNIPHWDCRYVRDETGREWERLIRALSLCADDIIIVLVKYIFIIGAKKEPKYIYLILTWFVWMRRLISYVCSI